MKQTACLMLIPINKASHFFFRLFLLVLSRPPVRLPPRRKTRKKIDM
jgi:hypothetical protein